MTSLLRYITSGSLWTYYRDEPNTSAEGNISYSIKGAKLFDYTTSIARNDNVEKENVKIDVSYYLIDISVKSLNY